MLCTWSGRCLLHVSPILLPAPVKKQMCQSHLSIAHAIDEDNRLLEINPKTCRKSTIDLPVLPDPLPGDEAVLHASVLHVPMVQEHHGHGSLSDAHGAEEGQQRPQQNAFYDDFDDHASSPHSISVPALAVANRCL